MISFEEAEKILVEKAPVPSRQIQRPLDSCLGFTLAEEIRMDCDAPPFDRSMMDGYALKAADLTKTPCSLKVVGESRAGHPFLGIINSGEAITILTGAVVPPSADSVVPVEKTKASKESVEILEPVKLGQHIARKGEDSKAGDLALSPGIRIRPQELAILAALGKTELKTFALPRVGILATGDELVSPGKKPGPGQIRESNSYVLEGQAKQLGFPTQRFEIAPDEPKKLRQAVERALAESECLLVTGGISVGSYDYVAQVFEELTVQKHFHGVSVKPGKPIWFGTKSNQAVFGLPGNPVSSFVIFEIFVRPCLEKMSGLSPTSRRQKAKWTRGSMKKNPRLQFIPAWVQAGKETTEIEALSWTSSGDFYELNKANALLILEAERLPELGSTVEFLPI